MLLSLLLIPLLGSVLILLIPENSEEKKNIINEYSLIGKASPFQGGIVSSSLIIRRKKKNKFIFTYFFFLFFYIFLFLKLMLFDLKIMYSLGGLTVKALV